MGQVMDRDVDRRARATKNRGQGWPPTVFDLLHPGHAIPARGPTLGDMLVVALSDASVRMLKGAGRPILNQDERAEAFAALQVVDYVTIFDEETPR